MDKVYIVTSGSYSDYMIHAVFDSREAAEQYIQISKVYDPHIEDYVLNKTDTIQYLYRVAIGTQSGSVLSEPCLMAGFEIAELDDKSIEEMAADPKNYRQIYGHGKTPEAALKSAYDNRAKYLALKEGIA